MQNKNQTRILLLCVVTILLVAEGCSSIVPSPNTDEMEASALLTAFTDGIDNNCPLPCWHDIIIDSTTIEALQASQLFADLPLDCREVEDEAVKKGFPYNEACLWSPENRIHVIFYIDSMNGNVAEINISPEVSARPEDISLTFGSVVSTLGTPAGARVYRGVLETRTCKNRERPDAQRIDGTFQLLYPSQGVIIWANSEDIISWPCVYSDMTVMGITIRSPMSQQSSISEWYYDDPELLMFDSNIDIDPEYERIGYFLGWDLEINNE